MSAEFKFIDLAGAAKFSRLTETCGTCDGDGTYRYGVGSGIIEGGATSAAGEESACDNCGGQGWTFPEALIERVAKEFWGFRPQAIAALAAVVSYIEGAGKGSE